MPTFSSAPAVTAYDTNASQPLGALCTGMGYAPDTPKTQTKTASYIGGEAQNIALGGGAQAEPPKPKPKSEK